MCDNATVKILYLEGHAGYKVLIEGADKNPIEPVLCFMRVLCLFLSKGQDCEILERDD